VIITLEGSEKKTSKWVVHGIFLAVARFLSQWAVTLGRSDIQHATMCMSRFRAEPRQGHLQAVAETFGHLDNHRSASIEFRTGIPDCTEIEKEQPVEHDWSCVCGEVKEMTDPNFPNAKGKPVRASFFVDANLGHDKMTGRNCFGIISMLNLTPIDSCCKLTDRVETATCGSEFPSSLLPALVSTRFWQNVAKCVLLESPLMVQLACLETTSPLC